MSKPYTPRQKKPVRHIIKTKLVRIDFRTEIEVSASIPDDVARERYLSRLNIPIKSAHVRAEPVKEKPKEIPVGDINELEELIKETQQPEIEE